MGKAEFTPRKLALIFVRKAIDNDEKVDNNPPAGQIRFTACWGHAPQKGNCEALYPLQITQQASRQPNLSPQEHIFKLH